MLKCSLETAWQFRQAFSSAQTKAAVRASRTRCGPGRNARTIYARAESNRSRDQPPLSGFFLFCAHPEKVTAKPQAVSRDPRCHQHLLPHTSNPLPRGVIIREKIPQSKCWFICSSLRRITGTKRCRLRPSVPKNVPKNTDPKPPPWLDAHTYCRPPPPPPVQLAPLSTTQGPRESACVPLRGSPRPLPSRLSSNGKRVGQPVQVELSVFSLTSRMIGTRLL